MASTTTSTDWIPPETLSLLNSAMLRFEHVMGTVQDMVVQEDSPKVRVGMCFILFFLVFSLFAAISSVLLPLQPKVLDEWV